MVQDTGTSAGEEQLEQLDAESIVESNEVVDEVLQDKEEYEPVSATVQRAMKALQTNAEEGEPEETPVAKPVQQAKQPEKQAKQVEEPKELRPPARYNLEEKEDYNKLPPDSKKAVQRVVRDLESMYTKNNQALTDKMKEYDGLETTLRPYLSKWGMKGYRVDQAVAELAGFYDGLSNDPHGTMKALSQLTGVPLAESNQGQQAQAPVQGDISQHPAYQAVVQQLNQLQAKVDPVYNTFQSSQQTQFNSQVNTITEEIESVREEKDSSGRYRFPELHDPSFFAGLKPLVSALKGASPSLSYADCLKRAYASVTGKTESLQNIAPRLPQQQTTQTNALQRARQASASVVGSGGTGTTFDVSQKQLPKNMSVGDTVRLAMEMLRNGS